MPRIDTPPIPPSPKKICDRTLAFASAFLFLFVPFFAVTAGETSNPDFILPLRCEIGQTCFIQNYVDHDPGPGYRDYRCGSLSYDGHTGTDLRVTWDAFRKDDVPVVAAASGRVVSLRDGEEDRRYRKSEEGALRGRELGNAVILDHGFGYRTIYGHMKRGSIAVRKGHSVTAGQVLGQVGLSGNTEFPHVHFEVRRKNQPIDPFVGADRKAACAPGEAPYWSAEALKALSYVSTGVVAAGFAGDRPSLEAIENSGGVLSVPTVQSPALVFWVVLYGVREGDLAKTRIVGPDGKVMAEEASQIPKNKAQWMSFVGKLRKGRDWPPGDYRGEYELFRQVENSKRTVLSFTREIHISSVSQ